MLPGRPRRNGPAVLNQEWDLGLVSRGARGEIRTPDLLVRSQTLYPTELRAHAYPERLPNGVKNSKFPAPRLDLLHPTVSWHAPIGPDKSPSHWSVSRSR